MQQAAADRPTPAEPAQVGSALRRRRHERGLSLRELAARVRVSVSLISQIERGRANPSVSTLYALANELDISLDDLVFADRRAAGDREQPTGRSQGSPVQRRTGRQRIRLDSGVIWERLTTRSEPGSEFLYVIYEVGGASSAEDSFQRHAGHEWGYVISGELEVTVGFDRYTLRPGDAVSLESTTPHRLANVGSEPAHAIWFVEGRDGSSSSTGRSRPSSG